MTTQAAIDPMHEFGLCERLDDGFASTFTGDFAIAEAFGGSQAVEETFERVMRAWSDDIQYMTTLCLAVNGRCWTLYGRGEHDLAKLYSDLYYRVMDHVYDDGAPFSAEDLDYFFRHTD